PAPRGELASGKARQMASSRSSESSRITSLLGLSPGKLHGNRWVLHRQSHGPPFHIASDYTLRSASCSTAGQGGSASTTNGSVKVKVVPRPSTESNQMRPPCPSTQARHRSVASPVPLIPRARALSPPANPPKIAP